MTDPEEIIDAIEQQQADKATALTLAQALHDPRYEMVNTVYDPINGSYVVLAERDPKMSASTAFTEMGYSSLSPFTAWTRDERVGELRDQLGIRKYYDMKRADGTVRGALRLVKTPVMAARWFVEPASDSTIDKNIAKFVENNLFNDLNMPFERVLEDALLMCEYGYMPLEKVYAQNSDGRIVLKKLAPRHPLDIQEWLFDNQGGPNGVIMNPTEANGWNAIPIPISKLVVFTLEQEAGDIRGISLLRSAYKHYFYKDCVDEKTEIFTQDGWKTQDKLNVGDQTLSINPNTGLSEWDTIKEVKRYPGTHDMIRMESSQFSALTTPDHRWLTKFKGEWRWRTTSTLTHDDNIPRGALCENVPTESKYTDEFVELVAWLWTEGNLLKDGFIISQSNKVNPNNVDRIRRALRVMCQNPTKGNRYQNGFDYWSENIPSDRPDMTKFYVGKELAKQFFTVFSSHKIIEPEFICSLTEAQLRLFVDVSCLGDGYLNPSAGGPIVTQENEEQLIALQMACTLLGIPTSLKKYSVNGYPDRWLLNLQKSVFINPRKSASLAKNREYKDGMKITSEVYEGIVWCPRTRNENWLAKRNGTTFFTGNTLYKIDAIQKERHGIGVPIIKLPMGYTESDKALAENLGRNLRTNERAHITIPANWEVTFAKLEGQPVDCMKSIEHHNNQIMTNILAPFYDDPNAKEDSMTMFYKATRYIASTIAGTFNRYVIKQLVDFNFGRGQYPILRARRIGENEDLRTWSFAFRNLVGSNAITPDAPLEAFLRTELDLPPADPATARPMIKPGGVADTPGNTTNPAKSVGPPKVGAPRQKASPPVGNPKGNAGTDRSGN